MTGSTFAVGDDAAGSPVDLTVTDASPTHRPDPLASVELFAHLDPEDRRFALEVAELLDVEGGQVVVEEGEPGSDLFVVVSGEASVLVGVDGDRVEVARLEPGDTFGDLGLLLGEPRRATVLATRPVRLLRIDHPTLELFIERLPGFGLAFARDLARRLQFALGHSTDARLESEPDKVVVPAQDLARMRSYMARYYVSAVRNVVKRHRLLVSRDFPRYECEISVTPEDQRKWFELFDVGEGLTHTPFTYYTSSGTMLLMKVVEDVGVNFRHLMHLRTDMTFAADGRVMEPGVGYRLSARLADIVPMGDDKVTLVIESRIEDPERVVVQLNREHFVILNVDPEVLEVLRTSRNGQGVASPGLSRRPPRLGDQPGVQRIPIEVPEDMGMRYGKVSGDLNLVHTTRSAARVFGHPKPFIQGLCTANYVLRHLTAAGRGHVLALDLTFTRPIFVGQTVELRHDEQALEVHSPDGKLLAFGEWRAS